MAYTALYRKYRPLVFDEIVEQQHIVRSLKNAVRAGQVSHAYLFCGTRGTGKTTMAHILSRAINCLEPIEGNPCNQCEICSGILSGSIMDVLELDAASNNSVDNIRDIRDEVAYSPSHARYKVYIIDEVHMLSTGAFNALLKTLEEPPSHVVFILATTEPHRLPATVLSRCQRYDFHRISAAGITAKLLSIAAESGFTVDERAAKLIALKADGALRDALSILDRCISIGHKSISLDDVLSVAGIIDYSFLSTIAGKITHRDLKGALDMISGLVMEGKDIRNFTTDLIGYYRNLLVYKMTGNLSLLAEIPDQAMDTVKKQAKAMDKDHLTYIIKELSSLEAGLRWATNPRILLEVAIIKICENIATGDANLSLSERLSALERRVDALADALSAPGTHISRKNDTGVKTIKEPDRDSDFPMNESDNDLHAHVDIDMARSKENISDTPGERMEISTAAKNGTTSPAAGDKYVSSMENNAVPHTDGIRADADGRPELLDCWPEILAKLKSSKKMALYSCLLDTTAYIQGGQRVLIADNTGGMLKKIVSSAENTNLLEGLLKEKLGKEVKVVIKPYVSTEHDNNIENGEADLIEKARSLAERLNIPSLEVVDE